MNKTFLEHIITLCCFVQFPPIYAAYKGSTTLPIYSLEQFNQLGGILNLTTSIVLSNVAFSNVSIGVKLFKNSGSLLTENSENPFISISSNARNFTKTQRGFTAYFDIPPRDTVELLLDKEDGKYGWGTINWSSQDTLITPLTGTVTVFGSYTVGSGNSPSAAFSNMYLINQGNGF